MDVGAKQGTSSYPVIYGELLMFDSVVCYGILFGIDDIPAILRLYAVRFMLEHS